MLNDLELLKRECEPTRNEPHGPTSLVVWRTGLNVTACAVQA